MGSSMLQEPREKDRENAIDKRLYVRACVCGVGFEHGFTLLGRWSNT
jgi:hypothetical protein